MKRESTTVEPAPMTSALLPSGTNSSLTEQFPELTEEESALRHRLELRVERAFFQATVVLQELRAQVPHDLPHHALKDYWRTSDKVTRAEEQATRALLELLERQLYRSTHRCFDHYYCQRFGTFFEDYSPISDSGITRRCISG